MCGFGAWCGLTVFKQGSIGMCCGHVLFHFSTQSRSEHLHTSTDAEDGNLMVYGSTNEEEFEGVAHGVECSECGVWFFAHPEWIEVGSSREQYAVNSLQQGIDGGEICGGGNDHRCCSSSE